MADSTTADGSVGKPDGSYSFFRTSSLNCIFLEDEVGELFDKDLILLTSSNPRLLELLGAKCRYGEVFGVVKSTMCTGGFSISMLIFSKDEVGRGVVREVEECSPSLSSEASTRLVNTLSRKQERWRLSISNRSRIMSDVGFLLIIPACVVLKKPWVSMGSIFWNYTSVSTGFLGVYVFGIVIGLWSSVFSPSFKVSG